jgi:amino acid transporter
MVEARMSQNESKEVRGSVDMERSLGLLQAISLNIANMVGIGPFITIPAFIAAMEGPQAMIAWGLAALLVLCDGLVWSELGAALPGSGGSYHFLKTVFGPMRFGRVVPFLFIWQFLISGALEMASGYIGALNYLKYAAPKWTGAWESYPGGDRWIAVGAVVLVTALLCQRIGKIGWLSVFMTAGTLLTVLLVIVAGLFHLDPSHFALPENAFRLDQRFATGLGAAMLIAIYDYLGYYNICHLGEEVRDPARTIPRAIIGSVIVIALIYWTMNLCIIGVIPWQEAMQSKNIAADFMERLFGRPWAVAFTWLILWTAMACMFSITLGYSRIPFAAARSGDFFKPFGYLHPTGGYPLISLLVLAALTSIFCFFELGDVIAAAVCVRIVVQFLGQIVALDWIRRHRPEIKLPFRMWFYPVPSLVAAAGWIFVLATAQSRVLILSLLVVLSGLAIFWLWKTRSSVAA